MQLGKIHIFLTGICMYTELSVVVVFFFFFVPWVSDFFFFFFYFHVHFFIFLPVYTVLECCLLIYSSFLFSILCSIP